MALAISLPARCEDRQGCLLGADMEALMVTLLTFLGNLLAASMAIFVVGAFLAFLLVCAGVFLGSLFG